MRFPLLLCCSLIGLSLAAMTDEQLVYGLAKLYGGIVDLSRYSNEFVYFTGAMMGWHINKNRATSVKFRVMEGLANIERGFDGNELYDHFATYNFSDLIDMEPYYTTFYNDSLSHLYLDHMWQTYQQLLIIKWADARTEIERVIVSVGAQIDMTDIPSSGLTRYSLMADGFALLAQLTGQSDRLASEIRLLKCKAELIDANIPNHVAEFARLQRKIVYTSLRKSNIAERFQERLNHLKLEWLDDTDDKMRLYQCCVNTNAEIGRYSYHLMTECLSSRSHAKKFCTNAEVKATGPLNKTLFYQHAAELARYHNVFRDGRKSASLQYKVEPSFEKPIRSFEPYEVIHELYTNFFETMNATECAKPKLDQLLANSKVDLSSSTKFQAVYDDLLDLFQSCWVWKF